MSTTITFRRGTGAPTSGAGLTLGEPAFDTTNRNFYIGLGSGTTAAWVGARISGSSGDIAAGLTSWIVNAKAIKDYVTNVAVAGSTTFATDISVNTLTVGRGSGNITTNTALGIGALSGNVSGSGNVAVGWGSLQSNDSGGNNVAIGQRALGTIVDSSTLTAVGDQAFRNLSGGSASVALGYMAGRYYDTGNDLLENSSNSVYIGYESRAASDGTNNEIVIGASAVGQGSNSTTIGTSATTLTRLFGTVWSNGGISAAGSTFSGDLNVNTLTVGLGGGSVYNNTAVGVNALGNPSNTGYDNTAIGFEVLRDNDTGGSNTALGTASLTVLVSGSQNTAIGMASLASITASSQNTALGFEAGRYAGTSTTELTSASNGIYIGYMARGSTNGRTNEIVIGADAVGMGSNTAVIGATTQSAAYIYGSLVPVGGISAAGITLTGNVRIIGDFTVDGTTTTINTTTISVDDKNIVLADISSPTDEYADGGGITLRGLTPKLFVWERTANSGTWTSSENLTLATGKAFYINTTQLLTEQGIVFVDGGTYT